MSDEVRASTEPANVYEAALASLPMPILIHDRTVIVFANEPACRVLHATSRAQVEGRPIEEIVHPDGHQAGSQRRRLALEHGQAFANIPVKLLAIDGTTVYVEGDAWPVEAGDEKAVIIVGRKVTE